LRKASKDGRVEEVKEILRDYGAIIDVNQRNGEEYGCMAAIHLACVFGHDSIVSLLLAHPAIDVNIKNSSGSTPFLIACYNGRTSCARLLLRDSRVLVNEPTDGGHLPLQRAATWGNIDVIMSWIASGREMELGKPGVVSTDAVGAARKKGKTEVVTLLERFRENPGETRYQMRVELGLLDEMAAEVFALVVFVSDGLLQIKDTPSSPWARFFSIASQLPLELQMVLCFRQVRSGKEIIPGKESEVAFKELARRRW